MQLIAYGDLNCPFCFVLERRLKAFDATVGVQWCLVEHARELPPGPEAKQPVWVEQLRLELERIAERAPDVKVHKPSYRPNSGAAIRAVAEVEAVDREAASRLRIALFDAIWVHGQDISDPDVIARCAKIARVEHIPHTPGAVDTVAQWYRAWKDPLYDRIPVLVSSGGPKLLGLAEPRRLELFLKSALFSSSTDDAC